MTTDASTPHTMLERARRAFATGDARRGFDHLRASLALAPTWRETLDFLLQVLEKAGRSGAELRWIERALTLDPAGRSPLTRLAALAAAANEWRRERAALRRLVLLHPGDSAVLTANGRSAAALGYEGEGLVAARRAFLAAPKDEAAFDILATTVFRAGRHAEALDLCETFLAKATWSPTAGFLHARILRALGRIDEAAAELDRCVSARPALAEHRRILECTITDEDFAALQ